ncbi:LysR family transcriptional regulator [Rhodococcus sp. D2-41]|uniref:LysR substrate-binding domain-containing protein n=1 Tax=Speluncibacter jeojiensis TaxID=2710754 RepID=UPI00240FD9BA|nr:LysR substrate-binding domain-containing protein [Rhodococcus sp. D2-41]MDG3011430.1 LysR family transcriptional regulator [Rhodococcus sp. D2-41]
MTEPTGPRTFRLAYVPGVTPAKWVRIWGERVTDVRLELVPTAAPGSDTVLRAGDADAGLLRLPVDRTGLSVIPLYAETPVVVVPKDHVFAAVDEVGLDDLADELVLHPLDDLLEWNVLPGTPAKERPATTADAVELVAAGVGVVIVPQSLARLHHRRDLTYRPLRGAPESNIGLAWLEDATTDVVEEFIGIVRGRTVNSSRGRTTAPAEPARKPAKKPAPQRGGASGKSGKPAKRTAPPARGRRKRR